MTDDEYGQPQAEITPPVDVWVTVTVDGTRVTRFEAKADETVRVHSARVEAADG